MKYLAFSIACLYALPFNALAGVIPVYYEAVITDVNSEGTLLNAITINTGFVREGAIISGTLNILEGYLEDPGASSIYAEITSTSAAYVNMGSFQGPFIDSRFVDQTDYSHDELAFSTGTQDKFSIFDYGAEPDNPGNYSKFQKINLSVADSSTNFIFSGDYRDLAFELFEAELFSGSMSFETYDRNNPTATTVSAYLFASFDLTYLRVGDAVPSTRVPQPTLFSLLLASAGFITYRKTLANNGYVHNAASAALNAKATQLNSPSVSIMLLRKE